MLFIMPFQMTLGSGLFFATLVVCLTIIAFRLIDVAVCAFRRLVHLIRDCWELFMAAASEDEPAPRRPAKSGRR